MSRLDQHFKESLKNLPDQKLSWFANWKIKRRLKRRALELSGRSSWLLSVQQLAAVPVALVLMVLSTTSYAFYSPAVVRGDSMYVVKSTLETWMYPDDSEDRVVYHLWLSDRRYDEVREILKRKGETNFAAFIPAVQAAEPPSPLERGNKTELGELDRILLETLQRASKNVEVAFVISDEIREVKKVAAVKEKIKEKVAKQKVFFHEMKPVLAKMEKPREERLARIEQDEGLKRIEVIGTIDEEGRGENDQSLDFSTELKARDGFSESPEFRSNVPSTVGRRDDLSNQGSTSELGVDSSFKGLGVEQDAQNNEELVVPEVVQVASIADFFEDQLNLQDELLDQMEKTVAVAEEVKADEVVGASVVTVMKSKVREMKKIQSELLADLDEDGNDEVLKLAKVVHEKKKKEMEEVLIAQDDLGLEGADEDNHAEEPEDAQDEALSTEEGTEIASVSDPVTKKARIMAPAVQSDTSVMIDPLADQDDMVNEMLEMAETMMMVQPANDASLAPSSEIVDIVDDALSVSDDQLRDECIALAEKVCGEKGETCVKEEVEKCEREEGAEDAYDPNDNEDEQKEELNTVEQTQIVPEGEEVLDVESGIKTP